MKLVVGFGCDVAIVDDVDGVAMSVAGVDKVVIWLQGVLKRLCCLAL
jgi:hypothetical protein